VAGRPLKLSAADEQCLKLMSFRNKGKNPHQRPDTGPERWIDSSVNLSTVHFTEASIEIVFMEGWLSRSHS